jgi:hypothetical protein
LALDNALAFDNRRVRRAGPAPAPQRDGTPLRWEALRAASRMPPNVRPSIDPPGSRSQWSYAIDGTTPWRRGRRSCRSRRSACNRSRPNQRPPVSAAADDWFDPRDAAELTIELATQRWSRAQVRSGERPHGWIGAEATARREAASGRKRSRAACEAGFLSGPVLAFGYEWRGLSSGLGVAAARSFVATCVLGWRGGCERGGVDPGLAGRPC